MALVRDFGREQIFFWAPTFKWGISIANISDMKKPVEMISLPQQLGACEQEAVAQFFLLSAWSVTHSRRLARTHTRQR